MTYLVRISARAKRDFASLYDEIDVEHSDAALKWYSGLKDAVLSLEQMSNRCSATPENGRLRQLLYGHRRHIYCVIFRVLEKQKQVEVLHIRHGARRRVKAADLE
jgi:plasmid stabilization system protein ParE